MIEIRDAVRHPAPVCFIVANLVFLLLLGARLGGMLEPIELIAYDQLLVSRPRATADPRIVLVEQTEEDIHRFGFPLSDEKLAHALELLTDFGARAIGVDIYRDIPVAPGAGRLAAILKRNPHIIWVMKFGEGDRHAVAPPNFLLGTEQIGFGDVIADPGGVVRRGLLILDDGKTSAYSLPLQLALHYLRPIKLQSDPANSANIRLGRTTIVPFERNDGGYVDADAAGYQILLDFADMPGRYKSLTMAQLLNREVDGSAIKDRIVIVGSTAKSLNDFFYTPYSVGLGPEQRMYGVELHAHVTNQLLRLAEKGQSQIKVVSDSAEFGWLWMWCVLGGVIALVAHSLWRFLVAGAIGVLAMTALCYAAILQWSYWIPLVPPVIGFLLTGGLAASYVGQHIRQERAVLMQLFSKHVSPDIAEALWRDREQFMEGKRPKPQHLTATVLATDIEGFTTVSEKLDPRSLLHWLNEYMEAMAHQVVTHHGVVDKYIGDAIMAVFGVPIARQTTTEIANDAVNAVKCALAMERDIIRLNGVWQARGMPIVRMRAGIYTGSLVAGIVGSADRLEYTVIGDTVNIAFRLESYDKNSADTEFPDRTCRILVGDSTRELLGDLFETRRVGNVSLKGKDQQILIHYVVKQAGEVTQST